jgi:hypothetical protein
METIRDMKRTVLASLLLACTVHAHAAAPKTAAPSPAAVQAAKYAVTTYRTDVVRTLAGLVSFNTRWPIRRSRPTGTRSTSLSRTT